MGPDAPWNRVRGLAEIEQHQRVIAAGEGRFAVFAVAYPVDRHRLIAQGPFQAGTDHRVIFNEKNAHGQLIQNSGRGARAR